MKPELTILLYCDDVQTSNRLVNRLISDLSTLIGENETNHNPSPPQQLLETLNDEPQKVQFETLRKSVTLIWICEPHLSHPLFYELAAKTDVFILALPPSGSPPESLPYCNLLSSLFSIPHFLAAITSSQKHPLDHSKFQLISRTIKEQIAKLELKHLSLVPVDIDTGSNITLKTNQLEWYTGGSLLHNLETTRFIDGKNHIDFRFTIENSLKMGGSGFTYNGTVESGSIKNGEKVVCLPSGKEGTIVSILDEDGKQDAAKLKESVLLKTDEDLEFAPGSIISRILNLPHKNQELDTALVWIHDEKYNPRENYQIELLNQSQKVLISKILYVINPGDLHRNNKEYLEKRDIGRVHLKANGPLYFDSFRENRATGFFKLSNNQKTVALGIIRGAVRSTKEFQKQQASKKSSNVVWEKTEVVREHRESRNKHKGGVLWFTGLSGSGKSTIAKAVEKELFEKGYRTVLLDGDNVRHGLCGDLGFNDKDRTENIRRVSEVAKLFYENGCIVLCTFISPFKKDRAYGRGLIPTDRFFEVYVKCDIEECIKRDPKGLYKKALAGIIPDFTGISSHYDEPENSEIILKTDSMPIEQSVRLLTAEVEKSFKM